MATTNQLILRDETLRVLLLILPDGQTAWEIHTARDPMKGGHVSVAEARDLADLLARPSPLATDTALTAARSDLVDKLDALDLDGLEASGQGVSVFRYDPERDESLPDATDHRRI